MVAKRIIPCLDIDNNRTVKGVNFKNLVDAGDPIELARIYSEKGADELVFLDITATKDKRKTLSSLAEKISENINIPFIWCLIGHNCDQKINIFVIRHIC